MSAYSDMQCPHCGESLRGHRLQTPVFDNRGTFRSPGGCVVDGSLTLLSAGSTEDGGGDE